MPESYGEEGRGLTNGLYVKPLTDNECAWEKCTDSTGPEGLLCPRHWRLVPGPIKEQYAWVKKQALLAVKASEELR